MFFVYKSNRIDILFSKICEIIKKKPLPNIFEREIIINENEILFQYLNFFVANKSGIAADFKLIHPNSFIWELFKKFLPSIKINNIFSISIIVWKIMQIIEENDFIECIKKDYKIKKKFDFSFLMASLYEKYILFRPNWINIWERKTKEKFKFEKDNKWQIKLWIEIINYTKKLKQSTLHFANLFEKFKKLKKKEKIGFPNRFFIISCLSLKPIYMKIFKEISIYTDVYFLSINFFEEKNFNFNFIKNKKNSNLQEKDSLINLCKQYENFYSFFLQKFKKIKFNNSFKENNKKKLLNILQNKILNSEKNKKIIKKKLLLPKDNSISINICYDKRHEIEVLYKNLLKFFNKNPKLQASDIVVTSHSLDTYITHIESIFKSNNKKEKIPFYISKKHSHTTEKILFVFNKILNLSNIRFNNEEILELIEIQDIADNFNISEEEINILYEWINKANIKWGIQKKTDSIFFKNNKNNWFYGINKILASYAINEEEKNWKNILSFTSINTSRTELIGKLIHLIEKLDKWRKKLLFSKKITSWRPLFECFIKDFFCKNKKIKKNIDIIHKNWIKMIDDASLAHYQKKIPIDILKKKFLHIMNYFSKKKFLPGVVNFCHPSLICYIPFKIKCIIGVDRQEIPKKNLNPFNLLDKYPLIGDFNSSDKICYLFLQNLISTQSIFYISYIGYSLKNDIEINPSVLIDQLLDYITNNFYFLKKDDFEKNKKKIFEHLLKKNKKKHFYEKKKIKKINFSKDKKIKEINKEIYNNLFLRKDLKNLIFNEIKLKNLINFWKNPIRCFFNTVLNIKFKIRKNNTITEPFLVDQLDVFKIRSMIFEKMLKKQNIKNTLKNIILSGMLPYGNFGLFFLKETKKEIEKLIKKIFTYRNLSREENIDIKIKQYCIKGKLNEIQKTGLLRWKLSTINYKDQISLWLEHLIYCILGGTGDSKIIGYKNQFFSLHSLPSNIASNYLLNYIEGYIEGMKNPLLLTKSGSDWLDKIYDKKNNYITKNQDIKKKAYKTLYQTWIGNEYISGEKEDLYIQNIMPELNIKKICKISQKWLYPIKKYQKK